MARSTLHPVLIGIVVLLSAANVIVQFCMDLTDFNNSQASFQGFFAPSASDFATNKERKNVASVVASPVFPSARPQMQPTAHSHQKILPKDLYVVYGLESSGTTITAETIARAVGIPADDQVGDIFKSSDHMTQVHHISLPMGRLEGEHPGLQPKPSIRPLPMIPVLYPSECKMPSEGHGDSQLEEQGECRSIMGDVRPSIPARFFVNISSHVNWYRDRGVLVHPIMVVRDPLLHFQGILENHCENDTVAYAQYEHGRTILVESLQRLQPTMVSYETLLTLQGAYIQQIYRQLKIHSDDSPMFKNGNIRHFYVQNSLRPIEYALKNEDLGTDSRKRTTPSDFLKANAPSPLQKLRGAMTRDKTKDHRETPSHSVVESNISEQQESNISEQP